MGVLPCPTGNFMCVHTGDSADAPGLLLLLLGGCSCQGQLLISVWGLQRVWKEKHPTQRGRDLFELWVTFRTPSRSGKGLSQESFRLSSEASSCFINKYYLGQGIEPEIFKALVSSLTAKLKTWYFFPPLFFLYFFSPFAAVHNCIKNRNSWNTNQACG